VSDALRVEVRRTVDDVEWDALLARDPRAHVLQRPELIRCAAAEEPGWEPRWFEVRDGAGVLRSGMGTVERTRFGAKLRVAGVAGLYGGPVAGPDDAAAEAALARAFTGHEAWRTIHRELVWAGGDGPRGPWEGLQPLDAAVLDVEAHEDFDAWWKNSFPMNRRNESNRSDKRGLTMEIDRVGASLAAFHPLYAERSASWGVPALGLRLLERLVERFEEFFVVVARGPEGDVIGAHVCVDLGHELFAWVGTTQRRKDVFPTTTIVREEVRWCFENRRAGVNLGSSIGSAGVGGYKKLMGARIDRRWIVDVDRRPWRKRTR